MMHFIYLYFYPLVQNGPSGESGLENSGEEMHEDIRVSFFCFFFNNKDHVI